MHCVVCDEPGGYNRAVVDLGTGTVIGGFCRNCELDLFGDRLDMMPPREAAGCAFCDAEGHYALPKWLPKRTFEGDRVRTEVEFSVTETTVVLCDDHYGHLNAIREDPAGLSIIELLSDG